VVGDGNFGWHPGAGFRSRWPFDPDQGSNDDFSDGSLSDGRARVDMPLEDDSRVAELADYL
jgi:hypothetical protein